MAEVVLALDVPRAYDALALLDLIPDARWVKVGPVLMTREGPELVRRLVERDLHVFLDLKWHDIPHTVSGAVAAARELGVTMATVHTLGGSAMLEAATVAAGREVALVGVTVLTSHDTGSMARVLGRSELDLTSEASRLADLALEAGLRGVVCSPYEVAALRRQLGTDPWLVVPGIRRRMDPWADQSRVATARDAVIGGATHLVVGRPVLQAEDPAAVFRAFLEEARCEP